VRVKVKWWNVAKALSLLALFGAIHAWRAERQARVEATEALGAFLWFAQAGPVTPPHTGDRYFTTSHAGIIYYTETPTR
jgi:hypothetical protein